jgi:gluconolactonase
VVNTDNSYTILDKVVKTIGTTLLPNGNLAACFVQPPTETQPFKSGVVEITPDGEPVRTLADSYNDIPLGIPNDLIADVKGGLYFTDPLGGKSIKTETTTFVFGQEGTAVYYLNPQGELIRVTEWNEPAFPNGCELSPDGSKFYLDDALSTTILVYDVNEDGTLSNKRLFAELRVNESLVEKEKPWIGGDGMTIDREGNLYVATILDLGIQIFNKNGEFLGNIKFPKTTTNCIFGGDDLSTLFVTCKEQQVYSIQTKMKGPNYPLR